MPSYCLPKNGSKRIQLLLIIAIGLVSCLQIYSIHGSLHKDNSLQHYHHPGLDSSSLTGSTANSSPSRHNIVQTNIQSDSKDAPLYSVPPNKVHNLTFCASCAYNIYITCNERLDEVMAEYKLSRGEAQEELLVNCGIDYSTEPYVLLHVGPHKTGTTTIQKFLHNRFAARASYFEKDNITIPTYKDLPGFFKNEGVMLNFAHCMIHNYQRDGGRVSAGKCGEIRKIFPNFLRGAYEQSKNVLIVAEDLDRLEIDYVRTLYWLQPYRRIRVVVTYRRLHQWLRSFYDQIVKLYRGKYIQGVYPYPSFLEWIDTEYHHFKQVHSIEVANRYRNSKKFESVDLMNLHSGNLLEDLFCNHVPHANATCEIIKQNEYNPPKSNEGEEHEFERLATLALRAGKLKTYHSAIARDVTKKMKGMLPDARMYPKKCLNRTFLDGLLQTEKEMEETYFKEWYDAQGGYEGLKRDFDKSREKYCCMNTDLILYDGMYDHIFDALNQISE